jgi:hypothetical protein
VHSGSEIRTDSGQRLKQAFRIKRAAQAAELRPSAGADHFHNGRCDRPTYTWKCDQPFSSVLSEDATDRLVKSFQGRACAAIGSDAKAVRSLLFQEVGIFAQVGRNHSVVGKRTR